ncbi:MULTISPECIES: GNAT family N-acetyltransferase [Streptomyces]|uniref:GCN5-related N-acetyltransferase n=1 Tax=Streptomyces venezuelae (strain ATCC 10712 / CBS 650.69 / DSM 40230 / JCM 4526 / NBRC 13096 / PD 04745) TaxID=953739 RepID=F2REG8_STRVP|nr:GNAT family N-acetyltransferase [Streptomyces venezuelae]APE22841.1 GNAT family N-acetyltransferase [Streptomyces venezuelae]QES00221.1 GNAT family N-acetyltransferase [Streptomyces venezuelae ATCC 10712]QES14011.1 N-acetyltransferase [Streptomyces venezuelae]CCA57091.1 GCN5-related N-acetyltransferase [Streptomyces venezuelae ATCC 10712]
MDDSALDLRQVTTPDEVSPELRRELVACWVEVTNAGGAAGFPFPPVDAGQVSPAVDSLVAGLAPETSRLVLASAGGDLAGWLNVRRDPFALVAHWGTLHHVQTRTGLRGRGIGAALVRHVRRIARDEMGLEQLRLAARGGVGLETFYGRLGWREIGRWPGALRLGPGDDRDEILMVLAPL